MRRRRPGPVGSSVGRLGVDVAAKPLLYFHSRSRDLDSLVPRLFRTFLLRRADDVSGLLAGLEKGLAPL